MIENDCGFNSSNLFQNSTIKNNLCTLNTVHGIFIGNSSSNLNITYNDCLSNGIAGLVISGASDNYIFENNCSNNYFGIHLSGNSDRNEIKSNVFAENIDASPGDGYGIFIEDVTPDNNTIYWNGFLFNEVQARDDGTNIWNETYPTGGNYWSDYTGIDLNTTPTQDVPPADGFGDTPYVIDSDSQDNYPLMCWGNPFSKVESISQYFQTAPSLTITSNVYGKGSVQNVTLWYCYSPDNSSWGAWETFDVLFAYPWQWNFDNPEGEGYYEFFSIANFTSGYNEPMKTMAETFCKYDITPPVSSVNPIPTYWKTQSPIIITATANDNTGEVADVALLYSYSTDNTTWSAFSTFGQDDIAPWSWSFDFPDDDGYYQFHSIANDTTGNTEPVKAIAEALCGYDITPPVSSVDAIFPSTTQNSSISISYTMNDVVSSVKNVTLWYSSSSDGVNYGPWQEFDIESISPAFEDFEFDFPDGNGLYYQFYTRATDYVDNWESAPVANDTWIYREPIDQSAPESSLNAISPYWCGSIPITVTATALDTGGSGLANVTLWYHYSPNNSTWSSYESFGTDIAEPWEWTFGFLESDGYYEFYTVAIDKDSNIEPAPSVADTTCGRDTTSPTISSSYPSAVTTGDVFTISATITDNVAVSEVHVSYWFGTDNATTSPMILVSGDSYEFSINVPSNSLEYLHYQINAVDHLNNAHSSPTADVAVNDNDSPSANAGVDRTVNINQTIALSGSASTDNIGVVNYTWTFDHNGSAITLYGPSPEFFFDISGNYTITLNITDAAGNWDTDTVVIHVIQDIEPAQTPGFELFTVLLATIIALIVTTISRRRSNE